MLPVLCIWQVLILRVTRPVNCLTNPTRADHRQWHAVGFGLDSWNVTLGIPTPGAICYCQATWSRPCFELIVIIAAYVCSDSIFSGIPAHHTSLSTQHLRQWWFFDFWSDRLQLIRPGYLMNSEIQRACDSDSFKRFLKTVLFSLH